MSHEPFTLQEGAILVADAHCSEAHPEFPDFLRRLESGEITTPQLVLMGDIFDLLFGPVVLTVQRNREAIDRINALAQKIDVCYLEGNHDFQLRELFPDVRLFPLEQQPVYMACGNETVALAHGDLALGGGYNLYTRFIRSKTVLRLLNRLDCMRNHFIVHWLDTRLGGKDNCRRLDGFEAYIAGRIKRLGLRRCDLFIEGHFHQNRGFKTAGIRYFNLGAFACNQRVFIVQSASEQVRLKEVVLGKEP